MSEPKYATVTISDYSDYYDGTYQPVEVDLDISDPNNPCLRVWLDLDAPHSPAGPVSPVSTPTGVHEETTEAQEG